MYGIKRELVIKLAQESFKNDIPDIDHLAKFADLLIRSVISKQDSDPVKDILSTIVGVGYE